MNDSTPLLIDELRLELEGDTKKEVISIKDTMMTGFIALHLLLLLVFTVSYLLLND